jgi:pyruvate dehydrogenase E2 component (dihydrolipoyllysine-residue acetyltransferase)
MPTEVILPQLGETMNEGTIVEWLKNEGDPVKRGDVLFTLESDKATLEAESPGRGILRKILVPAGVRIPVLTLVGVITGTPDEDISAYLGGQPAAAPAAVPGAAMQPEAVQAEEAAAIPTAEHGGRVFSSPRARMRARELGVDVRSIVGSGPGGRIVEKDVIAFAERQPKATPMAIKRAADLGVDLAKLTGTGVGGKITQEDVERAQEGTKAPAPAQAPVSPPSPAAAPIPALAQAIRVPAAEVASTTPVSGLRRIIAERMAGSAHTTARVTLVTEADATALVQARTSLKDSVSEEWGFSPGYTDLLALCVARALREHPYMNARLNGEAIEQLSHVNLGMAVDAERGLLVPVIRDADRLGLREFGTRFRDLVSRAREGKSLPDELTGGTFTITNLGMFDVDAFTPVINPPELAILCIGRIQQKPVVHDGQVVARQMVTLSLTFDHRLVDGAPAARFLQRIKRLIENPYLLLG